MTAQRRELKGWRRGIALIALLASCGVVDALAGSNGRVVANRFSGLAISGFDPVAYFTDGRPRQGNPEMELMQGGVVWRFRNEGNRAFFAANPEVYGPQFGGYDPVDAARGVAFPGNPQVWLIRDNRLYLFGREQTRDAFAAAPANILKEARKNWDRVQNELP
jgi:hypothetical protein